MFSTTQQGIYFISEYSGQVSSFQLSVCFQMVDDRFNRDLVASAFLFPGRHVSIPLINISTPQQAYRLSSGPAAVLSFN